VLCVIHGAPPQRKSSVVLIAHTPPNWIVLSDPKLSPTEPVQFYNTSTHKSFSFDLTVYLNQYSLFQSFACLIFLKNNIIQEFALLNPFMRSVTQLPSKIDRVKLCKSSFKTRGFNSQYQPAFRRVCNFILNHSA
jgi:hypothetical protein